MQELSTLTQETATPALTVGTNAPMNFLRLLQDEKIQKRIAEEKKQLAENAKIYREKYGDWLTENDVYQIDRAFAENEFCANCKGLPCRKKRGFKGYEQVVYIPPESKTLYIQSKPCEYFKQAQAQKRLEKKFRNCKIPQKYLGKTFDDYEVTKHNEVAVKWAKYFLGQENPDKGLMFYGGTGVGKTFLASIVAQELLKKNKTVLFGDVPSILGAMKATFSKSDEARTREEESLDNLMKNLQEVDLLVLDDIGTEYPTEWAASKLYEVINNRYNADKKIIATSNFNAMELINRFRGNITGERIVSRLSGACQPVKIGGIDRRMAQ